jgi:beta-xylosidase
MPQVPQHLFALVRQACKYRPEVTAIVLFGLAVEGEGEPPLYMEIRFTDYTRLQIEGEHMMLSLDEAIAAARHDYGILPLDWRQMSQEEVDRIPW